MTSSRPPRTGRRSGRSRLAAIALLALAAPATPAPGDPGGTPPPELALERALPIDGPPRFEPSGLARVGGRLLCVSDKHDEAVYELTVERDAARARPALPIEAELPDGAVQLDLEGIAVAPSGELWLASEATSRAWRLPAAGGRATPAGPEVAGPARAAGLLARINAGLEGIALDGDRLYLAAEREPRGIVEVALAGACSRVVRALRVDTTSVTPPPGRSPDFSDLLFDAGRLYALVRNAEMVCELDPGAGFVERRCWSFREAARALPYADARYGMAEGLAMDAERVWLVLDNNGIARAGDRRDRRPGLLVLRRPADMR